MRLKEFRRYSHQALHDRQLSMPAAFRAEKSLDFSENSRIASVLSQHEDLGGVWRL